MYLWFNDHTVSVVISSLYEIWIAIFTFYDEDNEKSTNRRQLDALLDGISDNGLRVMIATAKSISEIEKETKKKEPEA